MISKRFRVFSLALLAMLVGAAWAQETPTKPIEGDFRLTEGQCTDQNSPCTINFEVRGEVAKTMFDHMPSSSQYDACSEGQLKTDGEGLSCYKSADGDYFCDFGYDFVAEKLVQSDVTC